MACFLVPTAEAIAVTIATKSVGGKERKAALAHTDVCGDNGKIKKTPFSHKLKWLGNLLWGGSALLAFEHLWHGEVVPWFPFLTAANSPADTAAMLHEMSTVGVGMALLVTAVWGCMLLASNIIEKRPSVSCARTQESGEQAI